MPVCLVISLPILSLCFELFCCCCCCAAGAVLLWLACELVSVVLLSVTVVLRTGVIIALVPVVVDDGVN